MWSSFLILLELYLYICSYQALPTYSMRVSVWFDAFSKQVKQANEISGNQLIFVVLNYSVMHGTRKEELLCIKSFCVCKYCRLEFVINQPGQRKREKLIEMKVSYVLDDTNPKLIWKLQSFFHFFKTWTRHAQLKPIRRLPPCTKTQAVPSGSNNDKIQIT